MEEMQLAPRSDVDALKARLSATGRVQVPSILPDSVAIALWTELNHETEWDLSVIGANDMKRAQLAAMTLPQIERAALDVEERARYNFHYVFDTARVKDAIEAGHAVPGTQRALFAFMNGQAFLNFARDLTGDPRINYVDMQATRYRPGHFLTAHSDEKEGANRLYAYVLNLTPEWSPDWGGLLLFLDGKGNVTEGFTPTFNALNILKVPTTHSVSMVTPSASGPRYSFTGWMRALSEPPKTQQA